MQNIIIYYFSATGNTLKVAKLYREAMTREGANVKLSEIKADSVPEATEYDKIGIAYPVHGFRTPEIVTAFAKRLKKTGKKTEVFSVKTSGEPLKLNDASSSELKKITEKLGYDFIGEYHYVMPYNMVFRHSDGMAARMLNTAKERVPVHAKAILAGKRTPLSSPVSAKLMSAICLIERPGMKFNGRLYRVNASKCVKCMACVNNCPVGNIVFENGKFRFGGKCIGCARCAFNCPVDAITTGLLNPIKVNGRYDFNSPEDLSLPRYCRKSYRKYFDEDKYSPGKE